MRGFIKKLIIAFALPLMLATSVVAQPTKCITIQDLDVLAKEDGATLKHSFDATEVAKYFKERFGGDLPTHIYEEVLVYMLPAPSDTSFVAYMGYNGCMVQAQETATKNIEDYISWLRGL